MKVLLTFVFYLEMLGCGAPPALTETTETTRVEQTASGGQVESESTETNEIAADGVETTKRESTTTTTPAPN